MNTIERIEVRFRGVLFNFDLQSPAPGGTGEFVYDGPPEDLTAAYQSWCQQPVVCGGATRTFEQRALSQPSVEVSTEGIRMQGHVSGYLHGTGFGAFDFTHLLDALIHQESKPAYGLYLRPAE